MRGLRVRITLTERIDPLVQEALERIPGVLAKKAPYLPSVQHLPATPDPGPFQPGLSLDTPLDALAFLQERMAALNVKGTPLVYARSGFPMTYPVTPLDQLPNFLPEVVERMYPYQKTGYEFFSLRGGGVAHWECISGEAEVIVNRAGAGRRMKLADLERRFNAASSSVPATLSGRAWDPAIPTRTRCMTPQGQIRLGQITAVLFRGERPLFRLTLTDGRTLRATADHVFPTPTGDRTLGSLSPGDLVWVAGRPPRKHRGTQAAGTRPKYEVVTALHHHPYASGWDRYRRGPGSKGRPNPTRSATVPKHRIIMEATLNQLPVAEFVQRVKSGDLGGLTFINPQTHEVHHRDRNPGNNSPENLELLTCEQHRSEHSQDGVQHVLFRGIPTPVQSVVPDGSGPVYDIAMVGPDHNFLANDIVVHNCGAGKTIEGIAFLDGDPGFPAVFPNGMEKSWPNRRAVIVTLATTTYQWGSVLEQVTRKGAIPYRILDTETDYLVRETPKGERVLRRCVPPEEVAPRWGAAHPKRILTYVVGPRQAPPSPSPAGNESDRWAPGTRWGKEPKPPFELGDEVPSKVALPWKATHALSPVFQEEDADLLRSLLGTDWIPWKGTDPDARKRLLAAGVIEDVVLPRTSRFQVVDRRGKVHYNLDGTAPVLLRQNDLGLLKSRLLAGNLPAEEKVDTEIAVLSGEGKSPDQVLSLVPGTTLDRILDIRARLQANQLAEALRGECDLGPDIQVVILSWQVLTARREFLRKWQPTTVLLDESHNAKSHRIWTAEEDGFGNAHYMYAENTAASTHIITETCPRVLELSATPATDRVRDWWGQLQVLTRGFGKYRIFADFFCDGKQTEVNPNVTVYDDRGISNPVELNRRLGFWVHRVSKTEMDRYLPPFTREIIKIPREKLASVKIPPSEWQAAKARGAQGVQELHILHAAAMKRPFIAERAIEHLRAGLKVVIFSGRILDCDLTYAEIRKVLPDIDGWCVHGDNLAALGGGAYVRHLAGSIWAPHKGPCFLIGTEDVWGTGVDGLQDTHRALRARIPITPLQWEQPEGRFDRGGSNISTTVEYFWGEGSIDDRIFDLFEDKMASVAQTYGKFAGKMKDVLAQFRGTGSETEALERMAERLVAGMPQSVFDNFDDDE